MGMDMYNPTDADPICVDGMQSDASWCVVKRICFDNRREVQGCDEIIKRGFRWHNLVLSSITVFPKEIILISVRWYCGNPLSYRNVRDLLAERRIAPRQRG